MKVTFIPIVKGALGRVIEGLLKGLDELKIAARVDTIKASALVIGQNTKKGPGDLRRLTVT